MAVLAKNVRTNKVLIVPDHYIGHPVLGKDLVLETDEAPAAPKNKKKQAEYIPDAKDADGDGLVQEGTVWERLARTELKEQPAPETTEE
jgi:hypothetical protein